MMSVQYSSVGNVRGDDFDMMTPRVSFKVADELFKLIDRNRSSLCDWFGWESKISSPEVVFDEIKSMASHNSCKYLLFDSSSKAIIGSVGVVEWLPANKTANLGFWLDEGMRRRKIMSRAIDGMEKILFCGDIMRIQMVIPSKNLPARALAWGCGYREEGTLRQAQIVRPGIVNDVVMYSKLKSEWEAQLKSNLGKAK